MKKMVPYLKNAYLCPCCNKWWIPEDAKPIYIPNQNTYNKYSRSYCYVIDAIALKMELNENISMISDREVKTIVKVLRDYGCIELLEGSDRNSLNHLDYGLSIAFLGWKEQKSSEKTKMVLSTIKSCANAITSVVELLKPV